jgi:hypothetical protein
VTAPRRAVRRLTAAEQDALPTTRRPPGMTEAQLLAAVRHLARLTGWLAYHTHDSRRSEPGFPDLVLVSARRQRVIYAELKTDTGRTTPEQDQWLAALAAAGQETALWRPADLPHDIPAILRGDRRLAAAAVRADTTHHTTTR